MAITINGSDGISDLRSTTDGSASTPAIRGTDTNTGIFFPAADTIAFAEGGTEVARFDSSGNLGIGTSSPWSQISSNGVSGATTQYLGFKNADGGDIRFGKADGVNNSCIIGTWSGNSVLFYSNSTERMRIDSSGNLLIGKTADNSNNQGLSFFPSGAVQSANNGAGTVTHYEFYRSGTRVGSITTTSSATSYVTSSDYRLKENIAPMTGALAKVALLKPVTYSWKSTGEASQGFIAHELQEVVPDAVVGEKDAVNEDGTIKAQGIDTSFLVATLTAALQEAHGLIKDLQARVDVLESK
jgi:hypothetical protein